MYRYMLDKNGNVDSSRIERLVDGATIPNADDNMDWHDYQQWLAAGNTPEAPK